ncbi:Uncharacterized protein PECH_003174 [Penicillium ucsense]|uniref:BTB domain transcription factor n=1 Tax=Penicillium ucsense TaxID=2839758 RepID=A0A8J8W763_9EURO|nr:Uncharacterized protein PECM_004885 [Penicillium ucsense]KAF7737684.1 Uncharacterized protein PECH_003174 [Penicillium ucsense]
MARTSSRQAAQKANEALSTRKASGKPPAGRKRKASQQDAPEPKKEKVEEQQPDKPVKSEQKADAEHHQHGDAPETKKVAETSQQENQKALDAKVESQQLQEKSEQDKQVGDGPKEEESTKDITQKASSTHHDAAGSSSKSELGVRTSEEREEKVSSNILEKGIIYFFYRARVNVDDPHGMKDIARTFIVLRPTPIGAELDSNQGPVDKNARCRLLVLPKKKFPTSGKERDMAFVEKANQSVKDLQEHFIAGLTYQTATRGERHVEEAQPFAEGVYAITSAPRASHLAYILTIPSEPGDLQDNFGIHQRGSFIVQSKNPKYPGPASAQLPEQPKYPESIMEQFRDLRWVPLRPEFIDYPNAQLLMIGEAHDSLGKAATAEVEKKPQESEPGKELEEMAHENEERVHALSGDDTIFQDLGLDAKKHAGVPTTWDATVKDEAE